MGKCISGWILPPIHLKTLSKLELFIYNYRAALAYKLRHTPTMCYVLCAMYTPCWCIAKLVIYMTVFVVLTHINEISIRATVTVCAPCMPVTDECTDDCIEHCWCSNCCWNANNRNVLLYRHAVGLVLSRRILYYICWINVNCKLKQCPVLLLLLGCP